MKYLPAEPYRRAAYLVLYIGLGAVALYVLLRYALPVLLPFFLAFAVASLLRRPARTVSRRFHLPLKVASVLLTVFTMVGLVGLFFAASAAAAEQLGALAKGLMTGENDILEGISSVFRRFSAFLDALPFLGDGGRTGETAGGTVGEAVGETLSELLRNALLSLAARLPAIAAKMVSLVPQVLFSSVVTILSAVYFSADYEKLVSYVKEKGRGLPRKILRELYGQTGKTIAKYLRAYFILFLFTFAELFLGFILLRYKYAFLLALLTALVDILPVLGTGTVLLPWAAYLFFAGNVGGMAGLLVLYGVVTVLRQLLEPRIVGAGIGMSPLLSLFSMYVGARLFGIAGLLLLPLAVAMVKNTVTAVRAAHVSGQ